MRRHVAYCHAIRVCFDNSDDRYRLGREAAVKIQSGETKAELERARQSARAYYIEGERSAENQLFGRYATQWYRVYKEPQIRAATRAMYRNLLNKHILSAFGNRNLRAIDPADIQALVNTFSGAPKSQTDKVIMALREIFRRALTYVGKPILDAPKRRRAYVLSQSRRSCTHTCRRHKARQWNM